jgi:Tol biopolymer transport system component
MTERRKEQTMHKLLVLAFAAAAIAAIVASPAAAKPPGSNGLISFTRFDPALDQDVVYTVNPDGSHEQQLMPGAESGQWSPDGRRIAIVTDCCGERILNPDTGGYTQLPTFYPDLGLFLPCGVWSPDAARLACDGFGDDPADDGVYTINSLDGGDIQRVTSGGDEDCPGDYSPNGKRIVFLRASFELEEQALYVVKADGTGLRQITPAGMDLRFNCGSWSPQGNEILFSARPAPGVRYAIYAVHADGSGLRQIPMAACGSASVGCFEPVWSPDGTKFAFTMFVSQTGQSDLYTVNADGTGPYQVTHAGLDAGLKDWGTHALTP